MQHASLLHDHPGPMNVLVAGATGGIGRALVDLLAARPQVQQLFAVSRNAAADAGLADLARRHPGRVRLLDCDITCEQALGQTATTLRQAVPALHLTINATGMLHNAQQQPEKSLSQVSLASMQASFLINAFGPMLLAKALLPLLRHDAPTVFASLSARVGSIGDNRAGGWYSYRAAKAAQNQFLRTLAIELARVNRRSVVLALHPGTTDSRLSKPFQANVAEGKLFSPEFAAGALLRVIAARTAADSGGFFAWDDKPIVW